MKESDKHPNNEQVLEEPGSGKHPKEKLVVITLAGFLLLNYPLAHLFSVSVFWFGIPLFYFYLFGIWLGFILLVAWILESPGLSRNAPETEIASTKRG